MFNITILQRLCSDCQRLDLCQNKATESENKTTLYHLLTFSCFLFLRAFVLVYISTFYRFALHFCEQKSSLKNGKY